MLQREAARGKLLTGLILLSGAVTYFTGLIWPTLTTRRLLAIESTYSVLGVIVALLKDDEYLLFFALLLFTLVFPLAKLITATILLFSKFSDQETLRIRHLLYHLGKWSMVDVFVVALTVVLLKTGALLKAQVHWGIYFFGLSVVLVNLATLRLNPNLPEGGNDT